MKECQQMLLLTSNSAGVILKVCPPELVLSWYSWAMQGCVPWEAETNSAFKISFSYSSAEVHFEQTPSQAILFHRSHRIDFSKRELMGSLKFKYSD